MMAALVFMKSISNTAGRGCSEYLTQRTFYAYHTAPSGGLARASAAEDAKAVSDTDVDRRDDLGDAVRRQHRALGSRCLITRTMSREQALTGQRGDDIDGFYNPHRRHASIGYFSPIEFQQRGLRSPIRSQAADVLERLRRPKEDLWIWPRRRFAATPSTRTAKTETPSRRS